MSRLIAALVLVLVAAPHALPGQSASPAELPPGARVRITRVEDQPREGTFLSQTADAIEVRWPGSTGSVTVPFAQISRVDVSVGRHRNLGKGMLVGTVAGGALGYVLGAATYEECTGMCLFGPGDRAGSAALGGVVFGTLGLVVGTVIGVIPHDRWQRVPLDRQRVSIRPRVQGTGLGLALQF